METVSMRRCVASAEAGRGAGDAVASVSPEELLRVANLAIDKHRNERESSRGGSECVCVLKLAELQSAEAKLQRVHMPSHCIER